MTGQRKSSISKAAFRVIPPPLILFSGFYLLLMMWSLYPIFRPHMEGVWKRYYPPQVPPGIIKAADAEMAKLATVPELYISDPKRYVLWKVEEKEKVCLVTYWIPAAK